MSLLSISHHPFSFIFSSIRGWKRKRGREREEEKKEEERRRQEQENFVVFLLPVD